MVDIGSQTTTLALFTVADDRVRRDEQVRVPLPLVRHVLPDRGLSSEAVSEAARIVRKLGRHARRRGCSSVRCVATSAVRDAANAPDVLAEVAERAGVEPELLDGRAEGEAAAVAVLRTLPVRDGAFFDLGGGSLQIGRLEGGRCATVESLPLGSLRLALSHLPDDPPGRADLDALSAATEAALAPFAPLLASTLLVGVGGTVRALAKVDRRAHGWPVAHSHGYWLSEEALDDILRRLARRPARERSELGVPAHRVHSIVAGAVAVRGVLRMTAARGVRVCGFGLRDGVAYQTLDVPHPGRAHRDGPDWAVAAELVERADGRRATLRRLLRKPRPGWYQEELIAAAAELGHEDAQAAVRAASSAHGWERLPPAGARGGRS
ncbi:MAG: hypothetical protein ACK4YP_23785 [Myxococcota bacterium]